MMSRRERMRMRNGPVRLWHGRVGMRCGRLAGVWCGRLAGAWCGMRVDAWGCAHLSVVQLAHGRALHAAPAMGASMMVSGRRNECTCRENGSKSHKNLLVHGYLPFRTFVLLPCKALGQAHSDSRFSARLSGLS